MHCANALLVIAYLAFVSACTKAPEPPQPKESSPAVSLPVVPNPEIEQLQQRISDLERAQYEQTAALANARIAAFDPSNSNGFARVDTDVGTFLVSLEDVSPYVDGQRITLRVGNPYSASFSGLTLTVNWGTRFPDTKLPPQEFRDGLKRYNDTNKQKTIELTDTLRPGTWNKVQFTIAPARTEEFGRLWVSIKTKTVQLIKTP